MPHIEAGDVAWTLVSTVLVLMMTIPGLALFYGGMVRKKNVLATVMQSFAITCLVSVLWLIVGYSLAFTPGSTILGGLSRIFLKGLTLDGVHELAKTIRSKNAGVDRITFDIIFRDRRTYDAVRRSGALSREAVLALYGVPESIALLDRALAGESLA